MPAFAFRLLAAALVAAPVAAQMVCTVSAESADSTYLRAEGITERVAVLRVACTGGTPTAAGASIPLDDFSVSAVGVGRITSKILSTAASPPATEALAILDDPLPTSLHPCTDASGSCPGFGNGTGSGYYGGGVQSAGSPNNRNVFQGVLIGTNTLLFRIPVDPPGPSGSRIFRFTNIRVNASELSLSGGSANVSLAVSATSNGTALPISGPFVAPVGTVMQSMGGTVRNAANTSTLGPFTVNTILPASEQRIATLRFIETEPLAFRTRAGESGFSSATFPSIPGRGNLAAAGVASHGTRLIARFAHVPPLARLFVQASGDLIGGAPLSGSESVVGSVRLISADTNGNGPFNPLGVTSFVELFESNGERMAVWEVTAADGAFLKRADLAVYASFDAGIDWATPTTVNMTLGPVSGASPPSETEAIPRFIPMGTGACIYTPAREPELRARRRVGERDGDRAAGLHVERAFGRELAAGGGRRVRIGRRAGAVTGGVQSGAASYGTSRDRRAIVHGDASGRVRDIGEPGGDESGAESGDPGARRVVQLERGEWSGGLRDAGGERVVGRARVQREPGGSERHVDARGFSGGHL
ncbi:MAG: hypothetical protein U0Q16_39775 [Bryobacteraceae bacterium]